MQLYLLIVLFVFIVFQSPLIYAEGENEFGLCKSMQDFTPHLPDLPPPLENGAVQLFADEADVDEIQGHSAFKGNVLLQRTEQILKTPALIYNKNQDTVNTDDSFTLWDRDFVIQGKKLNLRSQYQGTMEDVAYWLLKRRGYGHAEKITREGRDTFYLEKSEYSTCDPSNRVWYLRTQELTLDMADAIGTAHHTVVYFAGLPILYSPYLSFPLNDARKSGFLPPNAGSSDETGLEISLPYYWNLAPHYDATITPRLMTRRGVLLKTEFRYLTEASGGIITAEYLPNDSSSGENRASIAYQHQAQLTKRLQADLNFNYASDNRYFEELGNTLNIASITHLERRGDLLYQGDGWNFLGRLQTFQTLDTNPAAQPYQRVPQLLFKTVLPQHPRKMNFALKAEMVRFDRNRENVAIVTGNRLDLTSALSFPWQTASSFVVPKLTLRYTYYDLNEAGDQQDQQRLLYTLSTDTGLFLERPINLFKTDLLQTLEPRLFYRYTPYKEQSDLPVFDTARYDFTFSQLFREDSFSGTDRIDDHHQISLAITSRLLENKEGIERLRASLGQSYYFRDRRVTLPGEEIATEDSSSLIFELASQMTAHWYSSATIRWNPHLRHTEQNILRLRYHQDTSRILNLSYRLRENKLEQTDVSWYWPLDERWNIIGRWNYSLPDQQDLEIFTGLEYGSCCWAVRAIARRYLNTSNGDYLNAFFLQFHLRGLGGIGKKADGFLEQSIPGYHDLF